MDKAEEIRIALKSEMFRKRLKSALLEIYENRNRNADKKKSLIMKSAVIIAKEIQKSERQQVLLFFFISGEKLVAETMIMLTASKSNNVEFAKEIMLPAYELIANTAKSLLKINENSAKLCEQHAQQTHI